MEIARPGAVGIWVADGFAPQRQNVLEHHRQIKRIKPQLSTAQGQREQGRDHQPRGLRQP
jgi:hypothetical protein